MFSLGGRAIELALNQALALDPETRSALAGLDGQRIDLRLTAPALAMRIRVEGEVLRVGPVDDEEVELSLAAGAGALLSRLLPGAADRPVAPGSVRISGDAELAQRLQKLAQRYQPDFEEALGRVFGDVLGVQIAQALRSGLNGARRQSGMLAETTAEYLREESRDLVSRPEVEAHLDDVDALRDRAERLQARLRRLQQHPVLAGSAEQVSPGKSGP